MGHPAMRVSDDERDETVELLRGHMLAGRITSAELEDRVGEACDARTYGDLDHALRGLPPRPLATWPGQPLTFVAPRQTNPTATIALVVAIVSLCLLVLGVGTLSIICLPMSVTAWVMGRDARRTIAKTDQAGLSTARTAEVLGIIGTVLASSGLVACAAVITSF